MDISLRKFAVPTWRHACAAMMFLISFSLPGAWVREQKLIPPDVVPGDEFGGRVVISGNTMMVTAQGQNSNTGAVYVYQRSGNTWSLSQKLAGSQPGDFYGSLLALDGDTALLTSKAYEVSFYKQSNGLWTLQQKLSIATSFGRLAVSGDYAIIQGWMTDIYMRGAQGWTKQQTLTAPAQFAPHSAIRGDTAAFLGYDNAVYVYVRQGSTWSLQQKVNSSLPLIDNLGLSNDSLFVRSDSKVAVFTRSGAVWSEKPTLVPDAGSYATTFGNALAVSENSALIANWYTAPGAYIYEKVGDGWIRSQSLFVLNDSKFALSAALGTDTAALGSPCYQPALDGCGTGFVSVYRNDPALISLKVNSDLSIPAFTLPIHTFSVDNQEPINVPGTAYVSPGAHTVSILNDSNGLDPRYHFLGWADGNNSSTRTVNVTAPTTLTAKLVRQYHIDLKIYPPNSGTVSPTSGYFNAGQQVTVTATPAAGGSFVSWTGFGIDSVSGTSATVTMNWNMVLTATFGLAPTPGLRFVPITPCRADDTRTSLHGDPVNGGYTFNMRSSPCGLPATAAAYSFNLTAVPLEPISHIDVFPAGFLPPIASTLNSGDGRTKANAAIIPAGENGAVTAISYGRTGLVLDVNGYFDATNPNGLAFYPLAPCRIADTRNANGPLGGPILAAGQTRTFPVLSSACNIPATAKAYSLNVTAVPSGPLSYLTVFPFGEAKPFVSTLNAPTGTIVANAALIRAGTGGQISTYVTDSTHLVVDINGYFAPPGPGGLLFYPITPCRAVDTRNTPAGLLSAPVLASKTERSLPLLLSGCPVPSAAQAFSMNVTVVPPGPLGYLTVFPTGQGLPLVSTLNAVDADTVANAAIVPAGNGGSVSVFPSHATQIIFDLNGYFAP